LLEVKTVSLEDGKSDDCWWKPKIETKTTINMINKY
jgi:hypothetical protein